MILGQGSSSPIPYFSFLFCPSSTKLPKNYIIVVHVFINFTKHHFKMPWFSGNLHKTYAYFYNGHSSRILVY